MGRVGWPSEDILGLIYKGNPEKSPAKSATKEIFRLGGPCKYSHVNN